jgi:hypothetical protein
MNNSLRLDEVGDVARPFTVAELHGHVAPLAVAVAQRRLPSLALAFAVFSALSRGRTPRRSMVARARSGQLCDALVAMTTLDAREQESMTRVHDVVAALHPVCLDALEDLLANAPAIFPILEAERMHRVGMLEQDWRLVALPPLADGTLAARVLVNVRRADAEA